MFEPKKFNDIFEAMRDKTLESKVLSDFEVGSVTRTLLESFSWEMAALYEKMNRVYLSAFVDTAEGGHLDKVVSILGIKRGEPDFAIGEVTFSRDKGGDVLNIPVSTLVATEESPEMPQKVYQTTEIAVMGKDANSVTIAVQAMIAGEGQDTPLSTITVMPRPVAGVKSVLNPQAILLVGDKTETDEELRRRAKNTLLASGKATAIAIESALLALPEVTDVQVREDFKYAQGRLRLIRKAGVVGDINIPARSQIAMTVSGQIRKYEVLDGVTIPGGQQEVTVEIRSLLEGAIGEIRFPPLISAFSFVAPELAALNSQVNFALASIIVPGNFGVVRVFVDGPYLANPGITDPGAQLLYQDALSKVRTELDRVRAAGVYAILESARPVLTDLALLIELEAGLKPTVAERADLENQARKAVLDHFRLLRMEQPLVYPKLLRALTDLDGVENLSALRILTETVRPGLPPARNTISQPFSKIEVDAYERLLPRDVCVASEPKTLSIDFDFSLPIPAAGQEETTFNTLKNSLSAWFNQKQAGAEINLTEALAGKPVPSKIKLNTWCERSSLPKIPTVNAVFPTLFFEKAVLGNVFVYYSSLDITGALRLSLAPTLNVAGRNQTKTAVKKVIDDYLDALLPETPVLFDVLIDLITKVLNVQEVTLEADDFKLKLSDGILVDDRLNTAKKRIEVRKFEKAKLLSNNFLIADGRTNLRMEITGLNLNLFRRRNQQNNPIDLTAVEIAAVKNAVAVAVNSYFNAAEMGADILFDDFKNKLEGQASGIGYTPNAFTLQATAADGRVQIISLATPNQNIHVRSPELPVVIPITVANIGDTPV